jgi:MFS family permease
MLLCSAGALMCIFDSTFLWWSLSSGVVGFGMALLYPTLSAAVSDLSEPIWRSTAIGVYRFWRDAGYAFGAFSLGAIASYTGNIESAFWFVAVTMFISGMLVVLGLKETHPEFRN